jgi:hypothetical protein
MLRMKRPPEGVCFSWKPSQKSLLFQSRRWALGLSARNTNVFLRVKPRGRLACPAKPLGEAGILNQNPFFEIASKEYEQEP